MVLSLTISLVFLLDKRPVHSYWQLWTLNVDNNMKVDVVYTDIAKAFDSVSHLKLLLIRYKLIALNRTYLNG